MATTKQFEVYGAGVGFIGYVFSSTERGAKMAAKKLWPHIASFAVSMC